MWYHFNKYRKLLLHNKVQKRFPGICTLYFFSNWNCSKDFKKLYVFSSSANITFSCWLRTFIPQKWFLLLNLLWSAVSWLSSINIFAAMSRVTILVLETRNSMTNFWLIILNDLSFLLFADAVLQTKLKSQHVTILTAKKILWRLVEEKKWKKQKRCWKASFNEQKIIAYNRWIAALYLQDSRTDERIIKWYLEQVKLELLFIRDVQCFESKAPYHFLANSSIQTYISLGWHKYCTCLWKIFISWRRIWRCPYLFKNTSSASDLNCCTSFPILHQLYQNIEAWYQVMKQ